MQFQGLNFGRFLSTRIIPLLLVSCGMASAVEAKDCFLTIGGGYSPTGNQISLERNVEYFQGVLAESYEGNIQHDILFSDGSDPQRDLQYYDPQQPLPKIYELLGQVFDTESGQDYRYRNHQIGNLRGPSSVTEWDRWVNEVGSKMTADDRLFIYATAHGGKSSDKKRSGNTYLYLWNKEKISVEQFANSLRKLPENVPVVLVMVQCYSGGFANSMFPNGDPAQPLDNRDIVGFFATIETQPAAGCTADIHEENYHEYSSSFWAAISGSTRTQEEVTNCDCNGDGLMSFSEAHSYTVATSTTIDIPISTSDVFLRTYSKTSGEVDDEVHLLTESSPIEELRQSARPNQAFALTELGKHLELTGDDWKAAIAEKKKSLEATKKSLDSEDSSLKRQWSAKKSVIQKEILTKWPELNNRWHPLVPQIIADQQNDMIEAIESHPEFAAWQKLHSQRKELSVKKLDNRKDLAKCERVLYLLKTLALTANLRHFASEELQQRFAKIVALEAMSLGTEGSKQHEMTTITARKVPVTESTEKEEDAPLESKQTDEQPAANDR
ncbi:C13 family peptidase [Rubinisphaera sp.]|uniref:C13 family peptidase n=1 Tax=Rubinisphaera sp. TaxID=2024857 RepID=UPI000C0E3AFA|nr:C13 family peptidase [Rubinisphaera sp.]MBV07837.1 hypothetical protein [Rubinisphaera sp.]|tara:strand:- start:1854 stop:3515 length:1662 start_codon:yes stop_codon:yes gene_type:complete